MDSADQIHQVIEKIGTGVDSARIKELESGLEALKKETGGEKNALSVIKMMLSLTKYLGARKGKAYPGTLPAIESLAGDVNAILLASLAKDKTRIYARALTTFKSVKSDIESGKVLSDADLEALKAVILSVDWEISNITMQGFDLVLTRLETQLKARKAHHAFLRIMHQTGTHIARHKANAHKDSLSFLRWVFQQYEQLVKQPDMPLENQKKLAQETIQAFQAFKRKIDANCDLGQAPSPPEKTPPLNAPPPGRAPELPIESLEYETEESFIPALSDTGPDTGTQDEATLVTLDDPYSDPASGAAVGGGVSAVKPPDSPPKDIMGDLFSLKESPADELLDAIHLANVHGPGQENAAAIPGMMGAKEKQAGMQEFIPQRQGSDPIPEIEQRLDDFFNLNVSDMTPAQGDALTEDEGINDQTDPFKTEAEPDFVSLTVDSDLSEDDELPTEPLDFSNDLIPDAGDGYPADDIALDAAPDSSENTFLPGSSLKPALEEQITGEEQSFIFEDLLGLLNHLEDLSSPSILADIQDKIARLKDLWIDIEDKTQLLDAMSAMADFIHQQRRLDAGVENRLPYASDCADDNFSGTKTADTKPEMKINETSETEPIDEILVSDYFEEQNPDADPAFTAPKKQDVPSGMKTDAGQADNMSQENTSSFNESEKPHGLESPPRRKKGFFARLRDKFRG